jgi:hypothetical protein
LKWGFKKKLNIKKLEIETTIYKIFSLLGSKFINQNVRLHK